MRKLDINQRTFDLVELSFNPMWKDCIGEINMYSPEVRVGATIKKGQVLAYLETNRMLTSITAPFDGKIVSIERSFLDNPCDIPDNLTLFTLTNCKL